MNKYFTIQNILNVLITSFFSFIIIRFVIIEKFRREILPFFNNKLKNDKNYLLNRIKLDPYVFKFANQILKGDKEVVLAYLDSCEKNHQYSLSFRNVTYTLRNDKEVALKAVQLDYNNFKYLNMRLKDDKEVVFKAIRNNARALKYASYRLRNDKETVLLCTMKKYDWFNQSNLKFASVTLRSDKEIVLEHVKFDGKALEFASEKLQDDIDVVSIAVTNDGCALKFASDNLKDDWEIVMKAYEKNYTSIEYASQRLKNKINVNK
jgi:hypothetical protein